MKKLLVLSLAVAAMLCSCKEGKKKTEDKASAKVEVKAQNNAKTVTDIFAIAEENVDKVIDCKGKVKHVCMHSGKRCFLIDEKGNSLKVNASVEIDTFPKSLVGKTITVNGTLRMTKIDKKKVEEMEKEHDHCETEASNSKKMSKWMKEHNKDYYAFYYIDCIKYEEVK